MRKQNGKFDAGRRRLLRLLGLGAAGTALGMVGASNKLFAKQFVAEAARIKIPNMVYDPDLQMMVDPASGKPVYDNARYASSYPCVTAGCSDCPKRDDPSECEE